MPELNTANFAAAIRADAEAMLSQTGRDHAQVLQDILNALEPVNFHEVAELKDNDPVSQKIQIVITVQEVLRVALELNCGLCRNLDFLYAYNGQFWKLLDKSEIENFLGEAAARIGVDSISARYHRIKTELYKQFLADAWLPVPTNNGGVLINLKDCTGEITAGGFKSRPFNRNDFLKYQLGFPYDPAAASPKWDSFLNYVLPDTSRQDVLAEYIGYVFARHLKLEKTLILFGGGANGKSVFFDVVNALFGPANVSNISLESISKDQYYRAMLANKLLNYSSEISTKLQAEKFKQLTSGEPIEARLPYGQPMTLTDYARLAFNCNELPRDVEHSEAFFRRFLIVPFDVTVPEADRNPNLAKEIIAEELSGVFNWILAGLQRLLQQGRFSKCDAASEMVATFRRESDSVAMFIEDEGYKPSVDRCYRSSELYGYYREYCRNNGYAVCGNKTMTQRLRALGYTDKRQRGGVVVYAEKSFL